MLGDGEPRQERAGAEACQGKVRAWWAGGHRGADWQHGATWMWSTQLDFGVVPRNLEYNAICGSSKQLVFLCE